MKICILSMQDVQNFGSLLQSYSLKKILESLGHEVHFISIEPNLHDNTLMQNYAEDFSEETKRHKNPLIDKISRLDRYALNRIHIRKLADLQDIEFDRFRRNVLTAKASDQNLHYDCCVIGSDEVFNCMAKTSWGFTTQLFGNVRQADRVITYAASCGSTKIERVPEEARQRITEAFKNIQAFSVRDNNTKMFVSRLTDKSIQKHFDPVVIGDFSEEMQQVAQVELPDHYCLIYSYYNRISDEQEIKAIQSFCKRHDLAVISIGAPQMWIRNHVVATPFQMLNVFKQAEFVVTDTFHGTIFSAKYAKRFATMTRGSNMNKLQDLIDELGIRDHQIRELTTNALEKTFQMPRDDELIYDLEKRGYKSATQYLINELNG
ncbi:MAG: polysaccharide pyruvyl transferase family protein [Chordicoccus sp.]